MKIYDETKTQELNLESLDLAKGYLKPDKRFVMHHDAVEAKEAVYKDRVEHLDNGSTQTWKDIVEPAVEAKDAYDEYEDIQVYVPYTETELAEREISTLKQQLANTDYQAIKYAEGVMTEAEYSPVKSQRAEWRKRINELQRHIGI